jgi:uncharacterized protein YkwD
VIRLCTLLSALFLTAGCSGAIASVGSASTTHPSPRVASIANAGAKGRSTKRARVACTIANDSHRKHRRSCTDRKSAKERAYAKRADRAAASTNPAATIASVLATPCEGTQLAPEPGNLVQVETATLCLVNQERARNNELPLRFNTRLAQSSQLHSENMVEEDYFAHISPSGETPLDRIRATGYIPNAQVGYAVGENIAWGTLYLATPSAIVTAWIASPGHLANILDRAYRDSAIGVDPAAPPSLAEGEPGAIYTQDFGAITG